jgi:hypothetical protein
MSNSSQVGDSTNRAAEILRRLHGKFSANFVQMIKHPPPNVEMIEIKARAISEIGQRLVASRQLSLSQKYLVSVADDIFADITCSGYLAVLSLSGPAQIILRRALELGVGVIYLWDLPHLFWGWKDCDHDLNFREMVAHIESPAYITYLRNTLESMPPTTFDGSAARGLYRKLSNIVHGKLDTATTLLEERYEPDLTGWSSHLDLTNDVLDAILHLWLLRFPKLRSELNATLPQLQRVYPQL